MPPVYRAALPPLPAKLGEAVRVPKLKAGMDMRVFAFRTQAALLEANARIIAGRRFYDAVRAELGASDAGA